MSKWRHLQYQTFSLPNTKIYRQILIYKVCFIIIDPLNNRIRKSPLMHMQNKPDAFLRLVY